MGNLWAVVEKTVKVPGMYYATMSRHDATLPARGKKNNDTFQVILISEDVSHGGFVHSSSSLSFHSTALEHLQLNEIKHNKI